MLRNTIATMTAPIEAEEPLNRGYDAGLLKRLLIYLRPYKTPVFAAVLLLLGGAALTLVGPALTQRALDIAIPQRDAALLGTLAALYLGALLLEFLFEYGQTLLTTYVGQRIMTVMKEELGNEWLEPHLFRIGASSLLTDIERQLEHHVTGNYSAAHRHAQP